MDVYFVSHGMTAAVEDFLRHLNVLRWNLEGKTGPERLALLFASKFCRALTLIEDRRLQSLSILVEAWLSTIVANNRNSQRALKLPALTHSLSPQLCRELFACVHLEHLDLNIMSTAVNSPPLFAPSSLPRSIRSLVISNVDRRAALEAASGVHRVFVAS